MNKLTSILAFSSIMLSAPLMAQDIVTITPNSPPSGQAQGPAPFTFRGTTGARTQQVYSSSFFTGPQLLTSIAFRSTPNFRNGADYGNVIFNLSTTSFGDETGTPLSSVFANNIGSDETTVFSGALSFAAPATNDFEYVVNFSTPFLYDPAQGNLLLDSLIPVGASVSGAGFFLASYDVANQINDGVYSVNAIFDGAATSGTANTAGTISRFVGTAVGGAVPEPSAWAMMIVGFGVVGGSKRRQRRNPLALVRA